MDWLTILLGAGEMTAIGVIIVADEMAGELADEIVDHIIDDLTAKPKYLSKLKKPAPPPVPPPTIELPRWLKLTLSWVQLPIGVALFLGFCWEIYSSVGHGG